MARELHDFNCKLRLRSGRIVEPPENGHFFWMKGGQRAGSTIAFDWVTQILSGGFYTGVYVCGPPFGSLEHVVEFLLVSEIEAVLPIERPALSQGPYR